MKVKALLYCCKAMPNLYKLDENEFYTDMDKIYNGQRLNGKIVCECEVETEEIDITALNEHVFDDYYSSEIDMISKRSCLTCEQMADYLGGNWDSKGYALHLSNIKVFDKPRELSDYYNSNLDYLTTAPQNMCYAFEPIQFDEINIDLRRLVVISIQPQWVCKILNGEKTIEVRRKVLKGMCE